MPIATGFRVICYDCTWQGLWEKTNKGLTFVANEDGGLKLFPTHLCPACNSTNIHSLMKPS